ncbi:MAG: hypothetical protein GX256_00350 [Fretibacterium sp.]|nr:hypothetical protein [Fretibacterium sp.]
MSLNLSLVPIRILVTGTRGKSSLVRLLHAGLCASGLRSYARITGVLPRELSPSGSRTIHRSAPAHVREMLWWLAQLPEDADALVMENSAVAPDLQAAAGAWLRPTLLVWTTLRPDHEEAWGAGYEGAARALLSGVPRGVPVVGGPEIGRPELRELLAGLGCPLHVQPPLPVGRSYREENLALALRALELSGLPSERLEAARPAMEGLRPDIADFRVEGDGDDLLAVAFSANDVKSTKRLFEETGWSPEETTLLYHHRSDRAARLRAFLPWLDSIAWRDKVFTRTNAQLPFRGLMPGRLNRLPWNDGLRDAFSFRAWRPGRGRVFACGNVAGWPLEYLSEGASGLNGEGYGCLL